MCLDMFAFHSKYRIDFFIYCLLQLVLLSANDVHSVEFLDRPLCQYEQP